MFMKYIPNINEPDESVSKLLKRIIGLVPDKSEINFIAELEESLETVLSQYFRVTDNKKILTEEKITENKDSNDAKENKDSNETKDNLGTDEKKRREPMKKREKKRKLKNIN